MAVSYVTEKANVNTLSYVLSRMLAPSLQKRVVCMNLMYIEPAPTASNVVRIRKSGALTAGAQTESTAFALAANGELTDTYVDLTMAAAAVVSARSEQLDRFGGADGSLARIAAEQGAALARYVDNDALSLLASVSNTVTATAGLTFDDLATAQYYIFNANCPDLDMSLAAILGPRAFQKLNIAAHSSGAAAYANDAMLGIFKDTGGKPQANGYRGEIYPGIGGYMTTGFATTGGDDQQGLVHPKWGLAGTFDDSVRVKTAYKISEGFYEEVGSIYFYDVAEFNAGACCQIKSDT